MSERPSGRWWEVEELGEPKSLSSPYLSSLIEAEKLLLPWGKMLLFPLHILPIVLRSL